MSDDRRENLKKTGLTFDPLKVKDAIGSAINIARTDPFTGLGSVVSTGLNMRDVISATSIASKISSGAVIDPAISLGGLSAFSAPYAELSVLAIADKYRGTISSLASVAGVAQSMSSAFPSVATTSSITSVAVKAQAPMLVAGITDGLSLAGSFPPSSVSPYTIAAARWTVPMVGSNSPSAAALHVPHLNAGIADALSITRSIAPAYLSSAASVYGVESVVARAALSGTGSLFASTFLPGITLDSIARIDNTVSSLSVATKATWDRIGLHASVLETGSIEMWRSPAVELYASAHAAAAICFRRASLPAVDEEIEEAIEEAAETIESRLARIDGQLVEAYRGGVMAIESGMADWQRHSMTSFRELLTHVLHKLAPDHQVIASGGELHEGRPTRRARLTFIFSNVARGELTEFFEADMKAAMKLFDLLSSGTHKLGSEATPEQHRYLKWRLTGLIGSMLSARGY